MHYSVYFHSIHTTQQMLMSVNANLQLSHCLIFQFCLDKNTEKILKIMFIITVNISIPFWDNQNTKMCLHVSFQRKRKLLHYITYI